MIVSQLPKCLNLQNDGNKLKRELRNAVDYINAHAFGVAAGDELIALVTAAVALIDAGKRTP